MPPPIRAQPAPAWRGRPVRVCPANAPFAEPDRARRPADDRGRGRPRHAGCRPILTMTPLANLSAHRDDPRTLVVVFLRGAADGLTLVAPISDDNYHNFRPRLAVKKSDAVPLDGFFGLHPNLRPLEAAWKDGDLAIAHGAGVEDESRSHFEAQDFMEHGGVVTGGWLARFLRARGPSAGPLSAVALAPTLPEMLSGAPSASRARCPRN
jgi:uncharacterized protein (DUF1501 family)